MKSPTLTSKYFLSFHILEIQIFPVYVSTDYSADKQSTGIVGEAQNNILAYIKQEDIIYPPVSLSASERMDSDI